MDSIRLLDGQLLAKMAIWVLLQAHSCARNSCFTPQQKHKSNILWITIHQPEMNGVTRALLVSNSLLYKRIHWCRQIYHWKRIAEHIGLNSSLDESLSDCCYPCTVRICNVNLRNIDTWISICRSVFDFCVYLCLSVERLRVVYLIKKPTKIPWIEIVFFIAELSYLIIHLRIGLWA